MTQAGAGRLVGGRYRLIEVVGSGTFGRVWRARDETLGVVVAAKEPLPSSGSEQIERVARVAREARNAALVRDNPHIVSMLDVLDDGGRTWLIMQFVDGESLKDRLAAVGRLPVNEVARIAEALLDALSAAHAAGIAHRDIKPENVMIDRSGAVLLTDFGIAMHHLDPRLTNSSVVIGSPAYMAPERLLGADRGSLSDIYSLGATLYEAVEGVLPSTQNHATVRPPAHAGALGPLLVQMLDIDPDRRPDIARARAMSAAPGSSRHSTGPAHDTPRPTPGSPRSRVGGRRTMPAETSFGETWKTHFLFKLCVVLLAVGIVCGILFGISASFGLGKPLTVHRAEVSSAAVFALAFSAIPIGRWLVPAIGFPRRLLVITSEGLTGTIRKPWTTVSTLKLDASPVISWDLVDSVRIDKSGHRTTVAVLPSDRKRYAALMDDPKGTAYSVKLQGFRIFSGKLDTEPELIAEAVQGYRPQLDVQVTTGQRTSGAVAEFFAALTD